jgi:MHS family proline/betaine transporter-like MFS transporter
MIRNQQSLTKFISLVVLGNILEYYDFLLFAHLGFIITPLFFLNHTSTQTHILSLLLFGLSFIIRPIGGYYFGLVSDQKGRKTALVKSVKWAIVPALGLAFIPSYETIGIVSTYIFVFLRLLQGIALGGEYPTAGTYLMEARENKQGFLSSILVASGSVGSIIGLTVAIICMQENSPAWIWRTAFLFGGIGSFISYRMRHYLQEHYLAEGMYTKNNYSNATKYKRILIFLIGMVIGTTVWLPMTYSNFYVTKVLHYSTNLGLYASFVALIAYILLLPITGLIYDRVNHKKYMVWAALIVCPVTMTSFILLQQGKIAIAQIGLVLAAAVFGGPVHAFMNSLFPVATRGRNIGFLFMSGLSFGGMFPSLASYVVDKTRWDLAPAFLVSIIALISCFCFYRFARLKDKAI